MIVKCGARLEINPLWLASMETDSGPRGLGDGPSYPTVLVLRMQDGTEHRIKHEPGYFDGEDVFVIQRTIRAALVKLEDRA